MSARCNRGNGMGARFSSFVANYLLLGLRPMDLRCLNGINRELNGRWTHDHQTEGESQDSQGSGKSQAHLVNVRLIA